jgi:hypothetical protein
MVKHCRESEVGAQGQIMGVTQNNIGSTIDSLFVTQTMPHSNNSQMTDMLRKTMEKDS